MGALGISGNCPPKCKTASPEIWENTSFVVEFYKEIDGYITVSMVLSKVNIIMRVRIIVANFSNAVLFFHAIKLIFHFCYPETDLMQGNLCFQSCI